MRLILVYDLGDKWILLWLGTDWREKIAMGNKKYHYYYYIISYSYPNSYSHTHFHIFYVFSSDALDGFGITECGALACLSNPCRNGAFCVEDMENNNQNDDVDDDDYDDDDYINENDVNHMKTKKKTNHHIHTTSQSQSHNNKQQQHNHLVNRRRNNINDRWKCKCPTGYMGMTCEISVCDNNPCQYGGTCVTFPGSGYLCLCPFGKHGHYCEHSESINIYLFLIIIIS